MRSNSTEVSFFKHTNASLPSWNEFKNSVTFTTIHQHFHFLLDVESAISQELLLRPTQKFNRAIRPIELMVQELINANITGKGTSFTECHLYISATVDHPLLISHELLYVLKGIVS
jgi:hypothetical protein